MKILVIKLYNNHKKITWMVVVKVKDNRLMKLHKMKMPNLIKLTIIMKINWEVKMRIR